MRSMDRDRSTLLVVDLQARLVPALHEGAAVVENARRLIECARLLDVPVLMTEQSPEKLGRTVAEIPAGTPALAKATFDACRAAGFAGSLPLRPDLVIAGAEAHVCVLQTALGLLDAGRKVFVVADAIGSRNPANKEAAIHRLSAHGAEIVTTEMVVFEWLRTAEHPRFREAVALIK